VPDQGSTYLSTTLVTLGLLRFSIFPCLAPLEANLSAINTAPSARLFQSGHIFTLRKIVSRNGEVFRILIDNALLSPIISVLFYTDICWID